MYTGFRKASDTVLPCGMSSNQVRIVAVRIVGVRVHTSCWGSEVIVRPRHRITWLYRDDLGHIASTGDRYIPRSGNARSGEIIQIPRIENNAKCMREILPTYFWCYGVPFFCGE